MVKVESIASLPGLGMAPEGHSSYSCNFAGIVAVVFALWFAW